MTTDSQKIEGIECNVSVLYRKNDRKTEPLSPANNRGHGRIRPHRPLTCCCSDRQPVASTLAYRSCAKTNTPYNSGRPLRASRHIIVADQLNISRALIFPDPEVADYQAPNAHRYKVIFEIAYSQMVGALQKQQPSIVKNIEASVDDLLLEKTRGD